MEINITDYLSENEIKNICIDHVKQMLSKGGERLITNMAYNAAWNILDQSLDEESITTIRNKTKEVVSDVQSYHIFRPKDVWNSEESPAYKTLKSAMVENDQLIRDMVKDSILKYDYESQIRNNPDMLAETLIDALRIGFTKKEG